MGIVNVAATSSTMQTPVAWCSCHTMVGPRYLRVAAALIARESRSSRHSCDSRTTVARGAASSGGAEPGDAVGGQVVQPAADAAAAPGQLSARNRRARRRASRGESKRPSGGGTGPTVVVVDDEPAPANDGWRGKKRNAPPPPEYYTCVRRKKLVRARAGALGEQLVLRDAVVDALPRRLRLGDLGWLVVGVCQVINSLQARWVTV